MTAYDVVNWIEAHPGMAGWMQVSGAVLAFLAAFIVPLRIQSIQRNLSAEERRRDACQ
jgi:hypothetical protein